ncbi:MAG: hypothetical protein CMN44_04030 [SAR116 cluster bacterium]|nr:hypothetical protein [SAR116 cluster bacterium]|tara:strand:- start:402 stop:812 length:411 start_codon:yes stop_codon:yes gene_type:complete
MHFENMFNNSRLVLTLVGFILMLQSIGFVIFASEITLLMFPFVENNPEALNLGVSLRYAMASGLFFIGMLLFLCRGVTKSAAQRLLFCCGLGFIIILLSFVYLTIFRDVNVSKIMWIIYIILTLLAFYVSSRKFQE